MHTQELGNIRRWWQDKTNPAFRKSDCESQPETTDAVGHVYCTPWLVGKVYCILGYHTNSARLPTYVIAVCKYDNVNSTYYSVNKLQISSAELGYLG